MNYEFYIFILYVIFGCQGRGLDTAVCLSPFGLFVCVSEIIGLERAVSVAPVATDTQEPD